MLECGLSQSNNLKKDYLTNNHKFNFKTKSIKYLFLMHLHIDHIGRAPLLYRRGFRGRVIVPEGSKRFIKDMLEDSAKIMGRDAYTLSIYYGKTIEPLYSVEDVNGFLNLIEEFPIKARFKLDENVEFCFIPSGHIIKSAQLELWITSGNTTKKILYTSDLGNRQISKPFVEPFEEVNKANLVIGETTYGDPKKPVATERIREKDINKLKELINLTCIEGKSKLLIPAFALDRSQLMLCLLYQMFKDKKDFNIPIIYDSPLGLKHLKSYFNTVTDENDLKLLKDAATWPNVIQIGSWEESKYWSECSGPAIIIASSGMMQNGRILTYLPNILKNFNNCIVFCGFLSENSLGWKIKQKEKVIRVNNKRILNRANIFTLNSFSSHIQYPDLLNYYSNINCEKIALVHGEQNSKVAFKNNLEKELYNKSKNTKVIAVNKSTVIHL